MGDEERLKIVLVGDDKVGKTGFFLSYFEDTFSSTPRKYADYREDAMVIDGKTFLVHAVETSIMGEDYYRLRPLLEYPGTDVFLICFSVERQSSFEHLESRWLPEIRHHMPTTPIILVATKIDLRGSPLHRCVTFDEGLKMAQKHNLPYIETSALLHASRVKCQGQAAAACSGLPTLEVDVFHLYFSVQSRTSLVNVETRWVPEIRHAMPDIPILLVATNIGKCTGDIQDW
ncbi:ras-like GTP-binding protein RhoL [Acanthaster planci]|uniref:Ras-like GTP-binding protein RhoL n=1 Tax=Acanthaster planci TaxID=133434 RepID=A0A8B7XMP4_ACAPL|nr:ras-like GTP-binding protein RhoL [Acanthaster planci]